MTIQGAAIQPTRERLPQGMPESILAYVEHVEGGKSIRAIARDKGCHPSTILRQIRNVESRRDDPLVDKAVGGLMRKSALSSAHSVIEDETRAFNREACRILMRLQEAGACLALVPDLEKAVVMRETEEGQPQRTATLDRTVAERMALQGWITATKAARVLRYRISPAGRTALRKMLAEIENHRQEFDDDASATFGDQHRVYGERLVTEEGRVRRLRFNLAESPVTALTKLRSHDGKPFLSADLVAAADQLREDFELAQIGPRVAQNWERFLTGGSRGDFNQERGSQGSEAARDRVAKALRDLGPGLGDVALRVCCFLEGLEVTEKRFGWSARSGKVVLRIALTRLRLHYDESGLKARPLIG